MKKLDEYTLGFIIGAICAKGSFTGIGTNARFEYAGDFHTIAIIQANLGGRVYKTGKGYFNLIISGTLLKSLIKFFNDNIPVEGSRRLQFNKWLDDNWHSGLEKCVNGWYGKIRTCEFYKKSESRII